MAVRNRLAWGLCLEDALEKSGNVLNQSARLEFDRTAAAEKPLAEQRGLVRGEQDDGVGRRMELRH
jgi:hypothetical protein